jgi:hypothetical protein
MSKIHELLSIGSVISVIFGGEQPMNGPIYRFFRGRFTNAWYPLAQSERDRLFAEMDKAFRETGGKSLTGLCYTCWSSEWSTFGVEVYPNLEAIQKWRDAMERIGCFQYLEIESMIGIQQAP